MAVIHIAGFGLDEQLVGQPVEENVRTKPGIIVVQDINTGKYAVSDTPDLKGALTLLAQGVNFNKVFENKYHKATAENVRIFYRQIKTLGQASEFELTRAHCRIALMGELAPPGQDEASYTKMKLLSERNTKYFEYLCQKIPSLPERMEKFNGTAQA